MEQQILGVALGVSAVGIGYIFSRVSSWTSQEVDHLRNTPRYYNFSSLREDISRDATGVRPNILVEGLVRKEGFGGLFSDNAGVEGAAKLVTTTEYVKVHNEQTGNWNEHSETVTNQKLSLPFKLSDRYGNTITVENVHCADNFRSLLQMVHQSKHTPEKRTVGDYATHVRLNEIPTGSLTREYLLLYGSTFAGLGDAMQMGFGSDSYIIFYPQVVSTSIRSLISQRETVAQIERVVSILLIVGGVSLVVLATFPLVQRWWQSQQQHRDNNQ